MCATELEMRPPSQPDIDSDRPTCPNCDFVHYENPAPTVQAWIDRDGSYLGLRRNQQPEKGKWNMPGGFVEPGEGGPEAIAREVQEETGLEIEVIELIGIFPSRYGTSDSAGGGQPIFDVAYRCREVGGELVVSDESQEAEWFTLQEFPDPAFPGEQRALAVLRERTG